MASTAWILRFESWPERGYRLILDDLRNSKCSFYEDDNACSKFLYFLGSQYFRTWKARCGAMICVPTQDHDPKRTAPIEMHIYASNLGMSLYATRKKRGIVFLENGSDIPFIAGDQPIFNVLDPFKTTMSSYTIRHLQTRSSFEPGAGPRRPFVGAMAVKTYNHLLYRASDDQLYAYNGPYLKALAATPRDRALDG